VTIAIVCAVAASRVRHVWAAALPLAFLDSAVISAYPHTHDD
jgi:hypothetical protein